MLIHLKREVKEIKKQIQIANTSGAKGELYGKLEK
jgi:hypothetical protein